MMEHPVAMFLLASFESQFSKEKILLVSFIGLFSWVILSKFSFQ